MIVGKVKDTMVSAVDAYSTWKLLIGSSAEVCSTEGCSAYPTTALQVKMYGLEEVFVAPACGRCIESKSILTDLKEDTRLVELQRDAATNAA